MVEMKMGVHEKLDSLRIDVERVQATRNVVVGTEVGNEEARETTDPRPRVGLQLGVQPGIEEHATLRMLD
jgi:hypothetical protein